MVSKINFEARSVTVEWYERNETKGKEVELDAILTLNAELLSMQQQEEVTASMPKIIKQTSANALSRVSIHHHVYSPNSPHPTRYASVDCGFNGKKKTH